MALANFLWHGGPYLVLLATILIGAYQIGFIDAPAWSADVKKLETQLNAVQKDVGDVKRKVDDATTRQRVIESEVKNTNRSLDKITEQLNLLINRGLNDGGSSRH